MSRNGLWIVAAGVAGFVAAVTYWIIVLAVAESRKRYDRTGACDQFHSRRDRRQSRQLHKNVVDKLHTQGVVEALEHWKEEKASLPAQFLLESGRLVAQKDMKLSFRLASLTPSTSGTDRTANSERRGLEVVMKSPENRSPASTNKPAFGIFKGLRRPRGIGKLWSVITGMPIARAATTN